MVFNKGEWVAEPCEPSNGCAEDWGRGVRWLRQMLQIVFLSPQVRVEGRKGGEPLHAVHLCQLLGMKTVM